MSDTLALALALVGLAVALVRPPWLSEAVVAVVAAASLVAVGAVSVDRARQAVDDLAPTIGFLAALLLLADGCRRRTLRRAGHDHGVRLPRQPATAVGACLRRGRRRHGGARPGPL
jgi:arsenical pump membrane protein